MIWLGMSEFWRCRVNQVFLRNLELRKAIFLCWKNQLVSFLTSQNPPTPLNRGALSEFDFKAPLLRGVGGFCDVKKQFP